MSTAVIDCDYDADAASAAAGSETGSDLRVRHDNTADNQYRTQLRFPLSGVTAGSTVTDSVLQLNKTSENVAAGEDITIAPYNSTGDDDPDADDSATRRTRSDAGTTLVTITGDGTGSVTADLTATADAHIQGNISSPAFYSLALRPDSDWDDNDLISIQSIENAGTDPCTLTVTYTAPAAGAGQTWIGGKGKFI